MSQLPEWTSGVHHDGSELYVSNPLPALNERVRITLRIMSGTPVKRIFLRAAPDGEEAFAEMVLYKEDSVSRWYGVHMTIVNRRMRYRFKLITAAGAYTYSAAGMRRAEAPDNTDFVLLADFDAPDWLSDTVFYQIFPDRFYNGDPTLNPPEGVVFDHPPQGQFTSQLLDWDVPPIPFAESGTVDFRGGDLPGIQQKLDYLQDLGVNAIYLNPIFASPTNHRYNTTDFYAVDPYLGGNEALVTLKAAMDAVQMRLILDLTPNHCGHGHEWFTAAQADHNAPTADYFTFYAHPDDYEAWFGVEVLPKLNYTSDRLRDVMYRSEQGVMRYWLRDPFNVDGWRLDVWNMTARRGELDVNQEVAREMRAAVKEANPAAYMFGEHFYDATENLQGDALDAVMNYQGFSFPIWRWLAGHDIGAWDKPQPAYVDPVHLPAEAAAEQAVAFMAAVPWVITRMQFNLLGSHDTPRIYSIVKEDTALAKLAATLLLTFPGVPSVYYGDEIGLTGWYDPENRSSMVWNERGWNTDLRTHYQRVIALRRSSSALRAGGFRFVHADGALMVYLRESTDERMIIVAYRDVVERENVKIPVRHAFVPDGCVFEDVISGATFSVVGGVLYIDALEPAAGLILRELDK